MTVKVMKSGRTKEQKPYNTKCNNCACEFSFERSDAKFTSDDRDGDFLTVPCPECNKEAVVLFALTGWYS